MPCFLSPYSFLYHYIHFCAYVQVNLCFVISYLKTIITVHTVQKAGQMRTVTASSPWKVRLRRKAWMLGRPHSLALSKQQVLEQSVNSNKRCLAQNSKNSIRGDRIDIVLLF